MNQAKPFLMLALAGMATEASAHTFGAHGAGFAGGFFHPFTGLDHVLAMFAVGIWAAQLGGRALWRVPLAFVAMLALGGALGMAGGALPMLETGIAVSVLASGLLIASCARLPLRLAIMLAGLFALFHGYAHGMEMPGAGMPVLYALGFILATALLHTTGIAVGMAAHGKTSNLLRLGGIAIGAAGAWMLLGTGS